MTVSCCLKKSDGISNSQSVGTGGNLNHSSLGLDWHLLLDGGDVPLLMLLGHSHRGALVHGLLLGLNWHLLLDGNDVVLLLLLGHSHRGELVHDTFQARLLVVLDGSYLLCRQLEKALLLLWRLLHEIDESS